MRGDLIFLSQGRHQPAVNLSALARSPRSYCASGRSAVSDVAKRRFTHRAGLVVILRRRKWNHFSVLFTASKLFFLLFLNGLCHQNVHSYSCSRGRYTEKKIPPPKKKLNNGSIWQTHCNYFDEWKIVSLWSVHVITLDVWCVWWICHIVNSQLRKSAFTSTAKWRFAVRRQPDPYVFALH